MIKGLSCPYGQSNLVSTLSGADRKLIEPHLTPVDLDRGMVLEEADAPIKLVYFLNSGVGSTVAATTNGRGIEVGLFGLEGMSGSAIAMHDRHSTYETFMQIGGTGQSIEPDKLIELMQESPSLQRHLLHYARVMMTQTSQTALSNGQSRLEERLARWLLMCHDRISGDAIRLTHEFLSVMLGVRRAGVTVGTQVLEGKGLIRADRGRIVILDRDGLVSEAQETYGIPEAEYARLIGFDRPD
ncbi:MAG: Crp/Fnr family transcriptional regulator [Sulfitobacter sp.]